MNATLTSDRTDQGTSPLRQPTTNRSITTHHFVRTILVPVEFDERSSHLLSVASAYARQMGAQLVLFHVYARMEYAPPHSTPQQYESRNRALEKEAEIELAVFRANFAHDPEVLAARMITMGGFVEDEIFSACRRVGADLIIMSTHAYCGIRRLFLGSKAEYILRHSHCPVLVIPPPAHLDQPQTEIEHRQGTRPVAAP